MGIFHFCGKNNLLRIQMYDVFGTLQDAPQNKKARTEVLAFLVLIHLFIFYY